MLIKYKRGIYRLLEDEQVKEVIVNIGHDVCHF